MGDRKTERTFSPLLASLRRIGDDGAGAVLRPRTGLLPLLFLSALALWLVVSGVGSQPASAAVTNRGFETGDLTGWSTGTVTETVTVVGTDTVNADDGVVATPLEGKYMARLGKPQPTASENQPMGPNVLFQDFTITENVLRFAYNIWTYDYTGFDQFRWVVRLTDTDTVIGSFQTQAWGTGGDTSRKSSGWQLVEINTAGYQGRPAQIYLSSEGTFDTLYAFWVYIDSAEETLAPGVVDLSGIKVDGASPSRNPQTQTISITRTPSQAGQLVSIRVPIVCPDGMVLHGVDIIVNGIAYPMTKDGDDIWEGTFPVPSGTRGNTFTIMLRINCCGTIISVTIGSLTLVDPSGFVTDAVTGAAIPEATVTLQRLDGGSWADVNPYETAGDPPSPTISPQVNPELTDVDGHYAWDVVAGTYRVVVAKEGYATQTSPSVTVPPPVTDLNIELVPGAATPTPTATGTPAPTAGTLVNCPQAGKWAISVWSGQDGTDTGEALATCGAGAVDFAYYLDPVTNNWLGYFAGQPLISKLLTLDNMQGVLAHGAVGVSAAMLTPPPGAEQGTLENCPQAGKWAISVWGGQDGTDTGEVLATCGPGAVDFAYYLDPVTNNWLGYFHGLPAMSKLLTLDHMQGVLAHGAVALPATPSPTPTATPTPVPTPSPTPTPGEETGYLPPPEEVGYIGAGGNAVVTTSNDTPYTLTLEFQGPISQTVTIARCDSCHEYSFIGPLFCPSGRPEETVTLPPGTYHVTARVDDPSVIPFAGDWTLEADTEYFQCFYIVTTFG